MKHTEILVRIRQIIRSVNLESKRIEKQYGISIPQLLCLNFLFEKKDYRSNHKEIKEYLKLNFSTVTGIISRLEKKGYVARLPKQGDKRVALVSLTAKGAELVKATPEPLHERLSGKLRQLSPGELEQLLNSFDLIANFLHIEDSKADPIVSADGDLPDPGF